MNVSCIGVIKKVFHGERHERVKGEAWPPTLRVYSRLTLRPAASAGWVLEAEPQFEKAYITIKSHWSQTSSFPIGLCGEICILVP